MKKVGQGLIVVQTFYSRDMVQYAHQQLKATMWKYSEKNLGEFVEEDNGNALPTRRKNMKAWTDYPFDQLQDEAYKKAPVREIEVLSYDGDKYCRVRVCGHEDEIKAGYIYQRKGRFGEVPHLTQAQLAKLPKTLV